MSTPTASRTDKALMTISLVFVPVAVVIIIIDSVRRWAKRFDRKEYAYQVRAVSIMLLFLTKQAPAALLRKIGGIFKRGKQS